MVIGAKEGAAEAISMKVGTDVTDSVLKSADGADFHSINDYQLEDVLAVVVQGADCTNTADILMQLLAIILLLRLPQESRRKHGITALEGRPTALLWHQDQQHAARNCPHCQHRCRCERRLGPQIQACSQSHPS